jgi:hypothetical protein
MNPLAHFQPDAPISRCRYLKRIVPFELHSSGFHTSSTTWLTPLPFGQVNINVMQPGASAQEIASVVKKTFEDAQSKQFVHLYPQVSGAY